MYYVYVLEDKNDFSRYIGYTSDLRRRLEQHNRPHQGYTNGSEWTLVYYEAFREEKLARQRERRLKQDGRAKRQLFDRIFSG